jgi:hypothetical protein
MAMEIESHRRHFAHQVGEPALCMLMTYREFGVISRAFMLEEHGKILEQIRSRSGPFTNYSENELIFTEGRFYVELVERLCQLIEDFSTLCYALSNDLSAFPQNILSKESSVSKRLQCLTDRASWYTLLRYPDLDTLHFRSEDKEFLLQHYERNIIVLLNLAKVLEQFRKLHWRFYIKHKHANPLIYGIEKVEVRGERSIAIPAVDDEKHPEAVKVLLMNYCMYSQQRKIVNTIIMLMNDLLDRAILYIELNGKPIIETIAYYKMTPLAAQKLEGLIKDYNRYIKRNPIKLTLKVEITDTVIQKFVESYDNLDLGAFDT